MKINDLTLTILEQNCEDQYPWLLNWNVCSILLIKRDVPKSCLDEHTIWELGEKCSVLRKQLIAFLSHI